MTTRKAVLFGHSRAIELTAVVRAGTRLVQGQTSPNPSMKIKLGTKPYS